MSRHSGSFDKLSLVAIALGDISAIRAFYIQQIQVYFLDTYLYFAFKNMNRPKRVVCEIVQIRPNDRVITLGLLCKRPGFCKPAQGKQRLRLSTVHQRNPFRVKLPSP